MRKLFMMTTILILVLWTSACKEEGLPLPKGAKKSDSLCAVDALGTEGTCYEVPLSHYETIVWFEENVGEEGWLYQWVTDDEPFQMIMKKDNKKVQVIFYRQPDDQATALLIIGVESVILN